MKLFFMIKPIGGVAGNIGVFIYDKGLVLVDDQWEIIDLYLILETINSISKKYIRHHQYTFSLRSRGRQ